MTEHQTNKILTFKDSRTILLKIKKEFYTFENKLDNYVYIPLFDQVGIFYTYEQLEGNII